MLAVGKITEKFEEVWQGPDRGGNKRIEICWDNQNSTLVASEVDSRGKFKHVPIIITRDSIIKEIDVRNFIINLRPEAIALISNILEEGYSGKAENGAAQEVIDPDAGFGRDSAAKFRGNGHAAQRDRFQSERRQSRKYSQDHSGFHKRHIKKITW